MFENLDKRKLLLFGGIVAAIAVLAWFLYLLWRPEPAELPPGGTNVNQPGGLPPVGTGGPGTIGGGVPLPSGGEPTTPPASPEPGAVPTSTEITDVAFPLTETAAEAPSVTDAGVRYYDPATCQFYEVSAFGQPQALGSARYCQVEKITWDGTGDRSVLEFPDGANVVYDFRTGKQYTLPKEMTEFSFSSDGGKLAGKYLGTTSADNWLVTVNADGSALTGIEPMGDNADKVTVAWSPNNQVVAFSRTGEPAGFFQQQVLLIGFNGENFRSLNIQGRGFQPQWSPDGQQILYSVYSDATNYRPSLWLVNGSTDTIGQNNRPLNLGTWADKCTLVGSAAYCAVPQQLPEGSGFTPALAQGIPDTIWRVDLTTGGTTVVGEPRTLEGQGVTATNLSVSSDGRTLYFVDSVTGQLRSMQVLP